MQIYNILVCFSNFGNIQTSSTSISSSLRTKHAFDQQITMRMQQRDKQRFSPDHTHSAFATVLYTSFVFTFLHNSNHHHFYALRLPLVWANNVNHSCFANKPNATAFHIRTAKRIHKSKHRIHDLVYVRPSQCLMAINYYSAVYSNRATRMHFTPPNNKHQTRSTTVRSFFLSFLDSSYFVLQSPPFTMFPYGSFCALSIVRNTHTTLTRSRTWLSALQVVCKCKPPRERILSLLFFHLLLRLSCCCCCVSRQQAIGRWFIFYQVSKKLNAVANARFIRLDRVVSSRQVCVCVCVVLFENLTQESIEN